MPVPMASARGRFRLGFCTSAAAKVTLFHASLEKSEPTIAAPITGITARDQSPVPQNVAKLAAATSGWRKSVRPSSTRAASAPTLATLKTVWIAAPSVTPQHVGGGQQRDHEDGDDALRRQTELDRVGRAGQADLSQREEDVGADGGHQDAQELGERHRHGGDGAGLDDREQGPAVEEARQRREPLAQEDVLPAGLGHHRRQLGVGQRAGHRHRPGHDPDEQQRRPGPRPRPAGRCPPRR